MIIAWCFSIVLSASDVVYSASMYQMMMDDEQLSSFLLPNASGSDRHSSFGALRSVTGKQLEIAVASAARQTRLQIYEFS